MSETLEADRLTDEEFWEHAWVSLKVPARIRPFSASGRCLSRLFLRFLPDGRGKRLIEVGAAPGRWLVFFREKLGYAVDGIEYVASACRKTEENLAVCKTEGRIFQQDFFRNDLPEHSYDVVLSLGFIEHFTDLAPVVAAHTALLKPGGVLVLGVPNLRGLHGVVERLTDPETLAAHNVDMMRVPFMERLSAEHDLTPLWIGYTGGLSPGLISVADVPPTDTGAATRRRRVRLLRLALRLLNHARNALLLLDYLNGPLVSSYLLAIYRYAPPEQACRPSDGGTGGESAGS